MQKRTFEDSVGYTQHADEPTSTSHFPSSGGFGQSTYAEPTYPSANYANPGAV